MWAPVTATSWFSRALARPHEWVVLGHYANEGFKQPGQKIPLLHRTIEVVDSGALGITGSERHWKVINHLLPHPARFQLVWEKRGGKRDLYVWRAIPEDRERFVALGHFCTETDEEPLVECIRCVPKSWCVVTKETPRLVWEDSGTAGRKGSLWRINSMGLMQQAHHTIHRQMCFMTCRCRMTVLGWQRVMEVLLLCRFKKCKFNNNNIYIIIIYIYI